MFGRVLFITSEFGGLPHGMINSLKRMNVDYIESPIWNLAESNERFQPQVIIFFHHFLKNFEPYVKELGKINCHKILWSWEEPWEIDYIIQYHHFFTKIFTQDRNSATYINAQTNGKAIHVPHAADPESCKQIDVPFEYRSDLFFCGAAYPSRLKFFREVLPQLKDYKVVLGGTGWEFLPDTYGQKIINTGVGEEDYIKYVNGAKINVNLHRGSFEVPIANFMNIEVSSPNNRLFEINMCGGFQIVDDLRMPELREYYPDCITFSNTTNFMELFKIFIKDDEARKNYALKSRERSLEFHTYERRFIDIISKVI